MRWPLYTQHCIARCFSDGTLLDQSTHRPSGRPQGHGAHEAVCPKCGMTTWYDIRERANDPD